MRPTVALRYAILAPLALGATPSVSRAQDTKDFFGTWIGSGEDISCDTTRLGEGHDFFIFGVKKYENSGVNCKQVNAWMVGSKLRMSASCPGPEVGWQVFIHEMEFNRDGQLIVDGRNENPYRRCDPQRKLRER